MTVKRVRNRTTTTHTGTDSLLIVVAPSSAKSVTYDGIEMKPLKRRRKSRAFILVNPMRAEQ